MKVVRTLGLWCALATVVTSCLLAPGAVEAATLAAGTWLQFNFTDNWNPPAGNGNGFKDNFNYYIAANTGTNSTTGSATSVIDSEGNVIEGISLTASGWNGVGFTANAVNWVGMSSPTPAAAAGKGVSTWSNDEIVNFWWGLTGDETMTITGLDPTKTYDIYYYSKADGGGGSPTEAHTLSVNGVAQAAAERSVRFASATQDLLFKGIVPGGANNDTLTFAWSNATNPLVNAIVIRAVPEPGSMALAAIGVVGLICARRRLK